MGRVEGAAHGRVTAGATLFVAAVASTALLGWLLELEPLVRVVPWAGPMMPNTAIGLLLAAAGLALLRHEGSSPAATAAGRALAGIVAGFGALVVLEYTGAAGPGLDALLFPDRVARLLERAGLHQLPGRPALTSGISFLALGVALLLLDTGSRTGPPPAQILGLLPALLGIAALAGYLYRVELLFGTTLTRTATTPMAIPTAAAFVALGAGVLTARPDRGFTALFVGSDYGAYIARRLLPAAILTPLLLGSLRLLGERAGAFRPDTGVALYAVAMMLVLTALIGWTAAVVRSIDVVRTRTESALRMSEARFRSVFERSGMGILLADAQGRFTMTNPQMQRFLGYTAQELAGIAYETITYPPDLDADRRLFEELVAGDRTTYQLEKRYLRRDGAVVWGRLTVSSMADPADASAVAIAMVEDITRRKALEEERQLLVAVLEATPDFVGTADADGQVLSMNPGARRMVGLGESQDVHRYGIFDFHPAAERDRLRSVAIPAAIRDGVWTGESVVLTRDGREVPVAQIILAHRNVDGALDFLSTVIRDISERRRREADERFLLEASRVLTESLDEEVLLRRVARLLAEHRADLCIIDRPAVDASQRAPVAVHRDPGRQDLLDALARIPAAPEGRVAAGLVLATGHSRLLTGIDAQESPAAPDNAHASLLRALDVGPQLVVPIRAHHHVMGAITLARTRRHPAFTEEDRSVAEEVAGRTAVAVENCRLYLESRRATQTRDDVLRIVAHDLRNPISAIGLAAEFVLERLPPALQLERRQLDLVRRSADVSNRLIQDLLDVARMQAGRLTVEPAPVDPGDLVREAAALSEPIAAKQALDLEIDVEDGLPSIAADRDRLLQVFSNLIGNALKFTPRGGRIFVHARRLADAVEFAVSDSGPGIPGPELRHLFKPFWQARPGWMGAGLGLPLAKGIVEAHGGSMSVHSVPGAGATFRFTVPVSTAQSVEHPA